MHRYPRIHLWITFTSFSLRLVLNLISIFHQPSGSCSYKIVLKKVNFTEILILEYDEMRLTK